MYTTQGIVLKQIKYGETSVICKIFTYDYGIQSYMIKGVRNIKSKYKKANILFPGAVLDLVTYQQQREGIAYLKEYNLAAESIQYDNSVIVNCIQLFAIELLDNLLVDHQEHQDMYIYYLKWIQYLQHVPDKLLANAPLYYLIQMGRMSGYSMPTNNIHHQYYALLHDGAEINRPVIGSMTVEEVQLLEQIMQTESFEVAMQIKMSNPSRRNILNNYLQFVEHQMPGFRPLKCMSVLHMVLS